MAFGAGTGPEVAEEGTAALGGAGAATGVAVVGADGPGTRRDGVVAGAGATTAAPVAGADAEAGVVDVAAGTVRGGCVTR